MLDEETRYRLLKLLEDKPELTQRDLAQAMGISLGKVNFCLRALVEKGMVKAANFRNSANKKGYAYLLTPKGIEEKTRVTLQFLKRKEIEYQAIRMELEVLWREVRLIESKSTKSYEDL